MTTLSELRDRVAGARGADRELDCAIACAIDGFWYDEGATYARPGYCHEVDGEIRHPGQAPDMLVPRYSGSVDAALALIERVLPGWKIAEMKDGIRHEDGPYCHVRLWCPANPALGYRYPANGFTPALALVAALLSALDEGGRS